MNLGEAARASGEADSTPDEGWLSLCACSRRDKYPKHHRLADGRPRRRASVRPTSRRALLIGITYETMAAVGGAGCDPAAQLSKSTSSCKRIGKRLYAHGYDCRALFEDRALAYKYQPTMANIRRELARLVEWLNQKEGRQAWVHYCGHGSQRAQEDKERITEVDGMDEVIYPCDYPVAGVLFDDELTATFLQVRSGCSAMLTFDCCHSATLLDLPFQLQVREAIDERERAWRGRGEVWLLSATTDEHEYVSGSSSRFDLLSEVLPTH